MSVAATRARELGFDTLACASTGNLANSVAAHGAALGMDSYVLIPADLEEQKQLATAIYGTNLVKVRGNYDDVNRLCTELSGDRENWAFVNINMRPYYAEGSKTVAFEIAEQLGWEIPDRCVVPIASGSLFTKIAKGFSEWIEVGLLEGETPIMNGAQALGCSPVAAAFEQGKDVCRPVKPDTIAKSLAIGNPADGPYALDLARATGGSIDSVTDQEIRDGIRLLAETTGIFTETAGGVTTAVLAKLAARGDIGADERVVLVITGDGLKTLDAVRDSFTARRRRAEHRVLRSGVRRAGSVRLMAVTVKIPTQLRDLAGGAASVQAEGDTVGEALESVFETHERAARPPLRRGRRPAALHQRLPRRRGHPLPRRPANRRAGGRRADDPARGRGRLTPANRRKQGPCAEAGAPAAQRVARRPVTPVHSRSRRSVGYFGLPWEVPGEMSGNKSFAQQIMPLFGVLYVAIGLIGFAVTGFSNFLQNTDDSILLSGLSVNPFHNLVHLAIGAFLLIMSRQGVTTAEGACLGVGTFYVAAFVIGVIGPTNLTIIGMQGRGDLENFNHLINGVLLLGIGLISTSATEAAAKRSGIPAGSR